MLFKEVLGLLKPELENIIMLYHIDNGIIHINWREKDLSQNYRSLDVPEDSELYWNEGELRFNYFDKKDKEIKYITISNKQVLKYFKLNGMDNV
jgi:hypothetical protein